MAKSGGFFCSLAYKYASLGANTGMHQRRKIQVFRILQGLILKLG